MDKIRAWVIDEESRQELLERFARKRREHQELVRKSQRQIAILDQLKGMVIALELALEKKPDDATDLGKKQDDGLRQRRTQSQE